jgi:hypothetical protein
MHALPESGHLTLFVNVFFLAIQQPLKSNSAVPTDVAVLYGYLELFGYDGFYIPSDGTIMSRKNPLVKTAILFRMDISFRDRMSS